jgi:hypothetical protein
MKCWCRLCRAWVYEQHFEIPGQYERKGCGQGRDDIRYHPGNPLCGDVWRLKDGRYAVVDYKDPFCTGFTFSDGEKMTSRASQKYTEGVRQFLEQQQAELVSTFEELAYRKGIDHRGWTDSKYAPDAADRDGTRSLAFLKGVLKLKAAND